jgi:hypothetical protein
LLARIDADPGVFGSQLPKTSREQLYDEVMAQRRLK